MRARSVVDDIVDQLLELIRSGALREGDRLPAERELAERMHVARASVRAAVAHLQANGMVESGTGRRGTTCTTSWVPDDLQPAAAPDADRFRALLEARRVLEPALARLAAERTDHAGLGQLAARSRSSARWATTARAPSRPRAASTA